MLFPMEYVHQLLLNLITTSQQPSFVHYFISSKIRRFVLKFWIDINMNVMFLNAIYSNFKKTAFVGQWQWASEFLFIFIFIKFLVLF